MRGRRKQEEMKKGGEINYERKEEMKTNEELREKRRIIRERMRK